MTREEAIDRFAKVSDSAINSPDSCDVISLYESIKIIKEIYDSFENRSCNDCKYFTSSPNTNKYDCCEKGIADTSISFCCNKWESK